MLGRIRNNTRYALEENRRTREEGHVPSMTSFVSDLESCVGPVYTDLKQAFKDVGWVDFDTTRLGAGKYGAVWLGYKYSDRHLPPKERHLCAIKIQSVDDESFGGNLKVLWKEVTAFRALVHPHVIDYKAHFAVRQLNQVTESYEQEEAERRQALRSRPSSHRHQEHEDEDGGSPAAAGAVGGHEEHESLHQSHREPRHLSPVDSIGSSSSFQNRILTSLYIILELADGGDMYSERRRFPNNRIPEQGVRYYLLQMCSAVRYIHSRLVIHGDMHFGNFLLRFNSDSTTKKVLLSDFGLCYFLTGMIGARSAHDLRSDGAADRSSNASLMSGGSRLSQANADPFAPLTARQHIARETDHICDLILGLIIGENADVRQSVGQYLEYGISRNAAEFLHRIVSQTPVDVKRLMRDPWFHGNVVPVRELPPDDQDDGRPPKPPVRKKRFQSLPPPPPPTPSLLNRIGGGLRRASREVTHLFRRRRSGSTASDAQLVPQSPDAGRTRVAPRVPASLVEQRPGPSSSSSHSPSRRSLEQSYEVIEGPEDERRGSRVERKSPRSSSGSGSK